MCMEEQEWFSTSETAELLKVTPKTLRTWDKEGTFKPDLVEEGVRRYSQKQIERKAGKSLASLRNPIMTWADSNKIEDLICIAEEASYNIDFDILLGNTILEKYRAMYCELVKISTAMYRKNEYSPPNFIFTSPEIGALFECSCAGFAPGYCSETGEMKVVYLGTLNNRWRLYVSYLMPVEDILLGYMENGKIFEKEKFISHIKLFNYSFV